MAHVAKFTRSSAGKIVDHCNRHKDGGGEYTKYPYSNEERKYFNPDIDLDRTHLNYNLAPEREMTDKQYLERRLSGIKVHNRPDVNILCDWVITLPKEHKGDEAAEKLFFEHSYNFMKERYGEKNIVSAYVHMDETTPHIHFAFVPVVPNENKKGKKKSKFDEKLSAKEVINLKELYSFHVDLDNYLKENAPEYSFEVINEATKDGNKTVTELKRETELKKQTQIMAETAEIKDAAMAEIEDITQKTTELTQDKQKIIDRINYLEQRLSDSGAVKEPKTHEIPKMMNKYLVKEFGYKDGAQLMTIRKSTLNGLIEDKKAAVIIKKEKKEIEERESAVEKRESAVDKKEKELKKEWDTLAEEKEQVKAKESAANTKLREADEKLRDASAEYYKQENLNAHYEGLLAENNTLRLENREKDSIISGLKREISALKEKLYGAWETVKSTVQAVGMLKWDKGEYKADLTTKQSLLIDVVLNKSINLAEKDGFPKIAEEMRSRAGISGDIHAEITDLERAIFDKLIKAQLSMLEADHTKSTKIKFISEYMQIPVEHRAAARDALAADEQRYSLRDYLRNRLHEVKQAVFENPENELAKLGTKIKTHERGSL
jgi:hypothetical protein